MFVSLKCTVWFLREELGQETRPGEGYKPVREAERDTDTWIRHSRAAAAIEIGWD